MHRIRRTYADKGIKVRILHLQKADSHGTMSAVSCASEDIFRLTHTLGHSSATRLQLT